MSKHNSNKVKTKQKQKQKIKVKSNSILEYNQCKANNTRKKKMFGETMKAII